VPKMPELHKKHQKDGVLKTLKIKELQGNTILLKRLDRHLSYIL